MPNAREPPEGLESLGTLLLAVTHLSEHGYTLVRRGWDSRRRRQEWRVNVRFKEAEHTATGRTVEAALDRGLTWLRERGRGSGA